MGMMTRAQSHQKVCFSQVLLLVALLAVDQCTHMGAVDSVSRSQKIRHLHAHSRKGAILKRQHHGRNHQVTQVGVKHLDTLPINRHRFAEVRAPSGSESLSPSPGTELSPESNQLKDSRLNVLNRIDSSIISSENIPADLLKTRKSITQDIQRGEPDPSSDIDFEQTLDGVDHIATGYDISKGEFKLPMLVWMEYKNDPCGEGKTGRWCDNTAVDRKFKRDEVPSSIAVIRETSANSAVARRVFTNTKELAATEALYMGIKSPQGALTQWYDTRMLRDIQMHSDIMVARRQHKFYTLKLFPFNGNARTAAHLKIELADAFLERDRGIQGDGHADRSVMHVPDCVLHDCMLIDEVLDMPNAGCSLESSLSVQMPTCAKLFGGKTSKDDEKLRKACKSKFFIPLRKSLETKAHSLDKLCKDKAEVEKAREAGPSKATCKTFGADLGTICNANDMVRLGQFVKRWGTHFVNSASFGGEMNVQVQLSKTRPSGSTSMPGGISERARSLDSVREATDTSRRTIRRIADDAASAAIIEPQSASIAAAGEKTDFTKNNREKDNFPGVGGSLDNLMNVMYSSGVELGQDARRDALANAGVENIAVSFTGGTVLPASESAVTREQVEAWSKSVNRAPSLIHQSLELRPIFELLDHPSLEIEIMERAKKASKDGKKSREDVDDVLEEYKSRVQRRRDLLENYLRWFMTKSEALGTALDMMAEARTKSEFELRGMHMYVQQWALQVRAASGAGSDGSAEAFDSSPVKGGGLNSMGGLGKETGPGLRGLVAFRSDSSARSLEENAAETMLTYVLAYRRAAENFEIQCRNKCQQENNALLRRGVMYGEFPVHEDVLQNEVPYGFSGDKKTHDVTEAKFMLRRSRERCLEACEDQKKRSVRTSMQIQVREDMDEFLGGAPQERVGDATFELSTAAFFAGVDGACMICNGLVHTVASGQLPALAGGIAEPRDICHNRLFAATMDDLESPLTSDFNLDEELNSSQEDILLASGTEDTTFSKVSKAHNIKTHGSTICLGIVAELEDRIRIVLEDHGFAMPRRSRLIDLLRVWRSHTKNSSPRSLAYSLCRKFMHCSADEVPDPEKKTKSMAMQERQRKKDEADRELARLEKKISEIDTSLKVLPEAKGKELKTKKKELESKVKADKKEIKKEEKEIKTAEKAEKVANKVLDEEESMCTFTCLGETEWGKEYEKLHKNELLAGSDRRPKDDFVASRSTLPCGIEIKEKKEKKCTRCDSMQCISETRRKCYMRGSTTKCHSRWMMYGGEYYDALYSEQLRTRI